MTNLRKARKRLFPGKHPRHVAISREMSPVHGFRKIQLSFRYCAQRLGQHAQEVSGGFVCVFSRGRVGGLADLSLDPELLLRILLIGYLYGITSKRNLVEELRMHLAWRWFTGLGFDQEIPHHSTFSKNRHGRFQESGLFEQLFEEIVRQCVDVGLVQGEGRNLAQKSRFH